MTEVFYADTMEPLSLQDCQEIKRACEKHITALSMEPGDVLLVDNYRALHGRDVFQGDERRILEKNGLNKVINQMMDWLPKDFESNQS
jgi:alpha-ketoglutarate-dependent taurine dioxygenase